MTELEKELRASKIANIKLLAAKMVSLKFNEYKDYEIPEDKDIPYLNAMIDMLTKAVDNAELTKAKLIKFDNALNYKFNHTNFTQIRLRIDVQISKNYFRKVLKKNPISL